MRSKTHVSSDSNRTSGLQPGRGARPGFRGWWAGLLAAVVLAGLVGCGTNIDALLAQTGSAMATTTADILLTDFANQVADAFDQNAPRPVDDGEDADDGGDGDDDADGDDGGDADADGADGATLYADNCASCHGADGASGFAPDITGMTADELSLGLESGAHGAISLTGEQVVAIAEFLGG